MPDPPLAGAVSLSIRSSNGEFVNKANGRLANCRGPNWDNIYSELGKGEVSYTNVTVLSGITFDYFYYLWHIIWN